jgi:hypothetical protein
MDAKTLVGYTSTLEEIVASPFEPQPYSCNLHCGGGIGQKAALLTWKLLGADGPSKPTLFQMSDLKVQS